MALTLLQIIQRAQAELGLPQAATVIGNTDATTQQMFALANRVLDELRRCNPTGWTALQFEYDLAVPAAITCTGDLASANTNTITNLSADITVGGTRSANTYSVQGSSLPAGIRVASGTATSAVLNMLAVNTVALTGQTFTFGQDTFPEPPGFDWMQNRTMWDRTNRWELIGPDSPQVDQWHRSGIVVLGPRRHFRQVGPYSSNWRIWPPPFEITTPLQLVFEYLSTYAVVVNGSGTATPSPYAQYFANDADTCLLDENALIMGIKWMFWEIKGMGSYVTLQNRWVDYVDRLIARDGAAPTLQLAKRVSPIFISPSNVQDGFFPGPSGQSGI